MPTYVYRCPDCSKEYESTLPISKRDSPAYRCPMHKKPMRRVVTPIAIAFKGTGFYCTDHPKGK